jgi:signal transduction histidine kinase/DNA-binding response OmpR family regulator/ligand-binding sensor domain-containing protein
MTSLPNAKLVSWQSLVPLFALLGLLLGTVDSAANAQPASAGPSATKAIEAVVPYRSFTRADGLPHATVQALAQAPDGRLWIGTNAGLAVYDGHRIQPAPLPDSLEDGFICNLLTQEPGVVWAVVRDRAIVELREGRVNRVMPRPSTSGCVKRLIPYGNTTVAVAGSEVWTLAPDAETFEKTRFTYRSAQDRTDAVVNDESTTISAADRAPDGTLWVLDEHLGPGRLAPDGTVSFVNVSRFEEPDTEWESLEFSEEGSALVRGTTGTYRFRPSDGTLQRLSETTYARPHSRGSVVYATGVGTVRQWNFRTGRTRSLGSALGLPDTQYYAVLEDDRGGLWIGTQRGLLFLPAPNIRNIRSIDGQSIRWTTGIADDPDRKSVWVSSWGSGLFRLSPNPAYLPPRTTQHTPTPVDDRWTLGMRPHSPGLDALGQVGWFRRDGSGWQEVHPDLQALHGYVDTTGTGVFWTDNGIVRVRPAPSAPIDTLRTWPHTAADYHGFRAFNDGTLLLRARSHLIHLSPYEPAGTDTVASFPRIANKKAQSMALLNDRAWLGTHSDGLFQLDWQNDTARSLLPDRRVFSLSPVGDSLLVAGTNDGLYLIEAETGTVHRRLTTADGLSSNTAAGRFIRDTLYVRHPHGVTLRPQHRAVTPSQPPSPKITGFSVNGEARPTTDSTVLGVGERTLTFHFSGVHLAKGPSTHHSYRLVPYDTTWHTTDDRRTRYTDLPPGSYTFQMRTRVEGGPVGAPTSLRVTLPPAYYETTWFWWLCGLVGLGLLAGGYGLRVRALRRRKEELQTLVAERTHRLAEEKEKTQEQAERLAALDAEKNRFFANISHELRTPLTVLVGTLQEALDGGFGDVPAPLRRQLEIMQTHVDRLRRLAEQLLDLSRLEATDPDLSPQPRDLVFFVRKQVEAFAPMADRRGLSLTLEATPDTHPCRFDPEKLEKIISNLFSNALDCTPAGGQVTVRMDIETSTEDDAPPTTVLEVEDTGPGIPPEQQDEIFERFAHGRSADDEESGTGIGLSLAHELTQLHGGTITLNSTPGEGSTFTVRLPLPPADPGAIELPETDAGHSDRSPETMDRTVGGDGQAGTRPSSPDGPAAEEDAPTILVAEDNADVRAYLRRHLEDPWAVITTSNGAEALDSARRIEPDLVLADVMMPEIDGLTLTRHLREDDALGRIPILLLTARADDEDAVAGLKAGADDYVTKPFSIDELRARIEQLLDARRCWTETAPSSRLLTPEVEMTSADEAFLARVTDGIEEDLSRSSLTVEDLAAAVGISSRQLQRKLKRLTGHTAAAFVRRYRLECAADLLSSEATSVSQVAYRVGFDSPETFARHFKEHFDCSPSAYAEKHSSD